MLNGLEIVTLADAKAFLNMDPSVTSEDDELQSFITAMTDVVEAEVGPIVQRALVADIDGLCGTTITPPTWPVISVTSGTYLLDSSDVDVSKIVPRKGVLTTIDGSWLPLSPWVATMQVGRTDIPDSIRSGALEVLKLAWATQRGSDAPAFLISYRAAAWFKPTAYALGFA